MQSLIRATSRAVFSRQTPIWRPTYLFSDVWKDRDQAAEKLYITRKERQTMKKLLKMVEKEEQDKESNMEEFDRKLKDIMKRYKIDNEALAFEICSLHKSLTH